MALAMAWPCAGPSNSVRRISKSSVPCSSSMRSHSSLVDILGDDIAPSVECQGDQALWGCPCTEKMLPDDRQPSDNAWIVDNPYLIALRSELPVIQGTILKSTAAAKTEVSSARHGQETAFEEISGDVRERDFSPTIVGHCWRVDQGLLLQYPDFVVSNPLPRQ